MAQPEFELQKAVAKYLQLQYPNVEFRSDMAGVKVSKGIAGKMKAINKSSGWPDLFIAEPKGAFHGLYIELKARNIYKKDGALLKNDHLEEQASQLEKLKSKGYQAKFAVGFNEAKSVIDSYLKP